MPPLDATFRSLLFGRLLLQRLHDTQTTPGFARSSPFLTESGGRSLSWPPIPPYFFDDCYASQCFNCKIPTRSFFLKVFFFLLMIICSFLNVVRAPLVGEVGFFSIYLRTFPPGLLCTWCEPLSIRNPPPGSLHNPLEPPPPGAVSRADISSAKRRCSEEFPGNPQYRSRIRSFL